MGRRQVTICTDDLTGEEVPEGDVQDYPLRFGYDEYTLTLTAESAAKVREQFASLVEGTPHKDHAPKWFRDQQAAGAAAAGTDSGNEQPKTVTVVPPDAKTVRDWWKGLTTAQRLTFGLKDPPKGNTGRIPENVMAAFVASTAPKPAGAPTPAFSG